MTTGNATAKGAFSLMVVLVAVVVGIISFAAFIVLIAFADDLRQPEDGGEHALSKSAVGFAGLVTLLQENGRQVRISRSPLEQTVAENEFVMLTPPPGHELVSEDFYSIWGSNLIILPKWNTRAKSDNPEWVDNEGLLATYSVASIIHNLVDDVTVTRTQTTGPVDLVDVDSEEHIQLGVIDTLQTISGDALEPILTDAEGRIVVASIYSAEDEESFAYVISDPDLLNTHGLASIRNARGSVAILDLLVIPETPIAFDVTLHGIQRTRNILQLLFTPPFLAGILCLVFAGILLSIASFAGNLRGHRAREIPLGKSTLVDNSAQLISLAGRSMRMGERYVAMIRRQAAHAVGVPAGASESQQTAMLDTINRGSAGDPRFSELAGDVSRASKLKVMLKAMNRLYQWKQELGRERRRR